MTGRGIFSNLIQSASINACHFVVVVVVVVWCPRPVWVQEPRVEQRWLCSTARSGVDMELRRARGCLSSLRMERRPSLPWVLIMPVVGSSARRCLSMGLSCWMLQSSPFLPQSPITLSSACGDAVKECFYIRPLANRWGPKTKTASPF